MVPIKAGAYPVVAQVLAGVLRVRGVPTGDAPLGGEGQRAPEVELRFPNGERLTVRGVPEATLFTYGEVAPCDPAPQQPCTP